MNAGPVAIPVSEPHRDYKVFTAQDFGSAVTSFQFLKDGQAVNAANTQIGWPRRVKFERIFIQYGTAVINTAGAWTLALRKNASATNIATITLPFAATAQSEVHEWDTEVFLDSTDRVWWNATGPSRNILLARMMVEVRLL